jgi:hypothetical protein
MRFLQPAWKSAPRFGSALDREPPKGIDMTAAMWGIVLGMGLMFGASLYRYTHQPVRLARATSARQRTQDRLREHYGL